MVDTQVALLCWNYQTGMREITKLIRQPRWSCAQVGPRRPDHADPTLRTPWLKLTRPQLCRQPR
jgi:hypothetical protein